MIRSESLGTTTRTALTVSSLTTGARSVKPVTYFDELLQHDDDVGAQHTICGKILSVTIFCGRWSIMRGKLLSRQTRMALSGFANSRTTTGVICVSYSSSESFVPICITVPKTFAPPPPNSTDLSSSGKTFILKKSAGKSSATSSSLLIV
jgi:hypothetical protein